MIIVVGSETIVTRVMVSQGCEKNGGRWKSTDVHLSGRRMSRQC